jgi:PAS domain S-box-containing protein
MWLLKLYFYVHCVSLKKEQLSLWGNVPVSTNLAPTKSNNNHHAADQPTFDDLQLLADVSQLLLVTDLEGVVERVIQLAAKAVGATAVSLFVTEGTAIDWKHLRTMRGLVGEQAMKVVSSVMDQGFAGWVHAKKRGDYIKDTHSDDRWLVFEDDETDVRSALCVPFILDDEVVAVVTLLHNEPHHFNDFHLHLMTIVANQAASAIRNAQLFYHVQAHERQLSAMLQAISDSLIVIDHNHRIMLVNDAAMALLGAKEERLKGHSLAAFVKHDAVFGKLLEQIDDSHKASNIEVRSERLQKDFQVTISNWQNSVGAEHGHVIVMHDITEMRDLGRFKDEMLRVASHDLRSPLALIAGYADMINLDLEDASSPINEHVAIIKTSVERMGTLIDDVLRVERVRTTPMELHEQIDLSGLVKLVVVNMRLIATAKGQKLTLESQLEGIQRIKADPVLLRQAMENLISNAVKYTQGGGLITVKSWYDDKRFHFSVTDNGIGIDEEHLPYVFESFYRVEALNAAEQQRGSGLGLSLVYNVVARHHGDVWVKSTVGVGSTFGFWLPLPANDTADVA